MTVRHAPAKERENLFLSDMLDGLRDRIPLWRWYCLGMLGRHYPERAAQAVLPLLDDGEPPLRAAAARALAASGYAQALPRLENLLQDPYAPARVAALEAVFALKCPRSLERAQALLTDSSVAVRKTAARLLASCGHAAVPALERACEDSHPLVRLAAARALASCAGKSARAPLEKLSSSDPDCGVRSGVCLLLENL